MKLRKALTVAALSVALSTSVQAAAVPTVNLNGVASNVSIVKYKGATYIPLRKISEEMGVTVEWNKLSQTIKLYKGNDMVACKLNHNTARINSKIVKLDYPPIIQNDTTYVPLRFISEAFGATVNLNSTTNIVDVTFKKNTEPNNTSNTGYAMEPISKYGTTFKTPFYDNGYTEVAILTRADLPINISGDMFYDLKKAGNNCVEATLLMGRKGDTSGPTMEFTTDKYLNRYRFSNTFIRKQGYDVASYELVSDRDFLYLGSWKDFNPSKIEYVVFSDYEKIYAFPASEVFK